MSTKPKIVQAPRFSLQSPISESEVGSILLNRFVDIYGNNLDPQSDFSGIVYLTINPGSDNEEIISFTNGTRNADGTYEINTGIVRHLAAKSPYDTSGTPQAHSGAEDVVVSNEPQFYKAMLDYIDGLVLAAGVQSTKTTFGYVKQTETNQNGRVRSSLVSQRASPGLTVAVSAFSISTIDTDVDYTGGNSPAMTAPVSNPRIDLLVYDSVNTVIAVRTGSEAVSPVRVSPTVGDIPLASIYHRVGSTKILEEDDTTNSYILRWFEPSLYKPIIPVGTVSWTAGRTADVGYVLCDGTAYNRVGTYANLFARICPSQVFTVTIASPGVFSTSQAHGFVVGDKLHVSTTGGLPSGLATNTDYYVISAGLTATDFRVALTPSGSVINTTGSQSGVHTLYKSAWGKGDGVNTFNAPDLRLLTLVGAGATRNITLTFEPSARSSNTITVPDVAFPSQGQLVTLSTTGTLPSGLSPGNYYVYRASSTTISFCSSQANANAGTVVSLSDGGSGIHTISYALTARSVVGKLFGEETHGLAISENATHTHTVTYPGNGGAGTGGMSPALASGTVSMTVGSSGGDVQHNNMMPVAVGYWQIKY